MKAIVRVAFLSPGDDPDTHDLARRLVALEHSARVIAPTPQGIVGALERRLRRRGYLEHLTSAPASYLALRRGSDQVAHVAHPAVVPAATRWTRETGRPFVFHYPGVPDHADLVSQRRKLELMNSASRVAAAVVATSDAAARAFERWLGVEARVFDADAGPQAWLELYAEVTA